MDKAYLELNPTEAALLGAASRIFVLKMQCESVVKLDQKQIMYDSIQLALDMAKEIERKVVSGGETGL